MSGLGPAPAHWECDVVLVDGGTVHIRPLGPADGDALVAFHSRLSPETVHFRFFTATPTLSAKQVQWFTHVDHRDRVALVAELGDRLVGVARYDRQLGTDAAEVAFVVADDHQGRGIGTLLLEHLAAIAREHGIGRFVADTLPDNRRMLEVFRTAGFEDEARLDAGIVRVELLIEPTERATAAAEQREHQAEAASVARLLTPGSVAVIGAGRTPGTVGHEVLRNLLAGGFTGSVHPVNPNATAIAGRAAYPRIGDVPGPVDLAVIAVPAPAVLDSVRQCAAKGVHGIVVLSAGFGEVGAGDAEAALRDLARRNGMRIVGPNCIGIANTAIGLNATFAPGAPTPGRVAMQSQSGALGIALLERSTRMGIGISTFVSVGNKADVSGNDLLQYWEDDPATRVVLLYLESVGNPGKFARIARRVSRRKPIVAVKSGRSAAGVRAASSHTAAMATPDVAVDALFRQAGVIRVDTLDELFDMALVLSSQPVPRGNRVAVVGNSGGPGILATDACAATGLEVPELSTATQEALRAVVDPNAAVANPVDLVASATPEGYEQALRVVLDDDGIDAAIVIATRTFAAAPDAVADVLRRVSSSTPKTVVGCFLAAPNTPPLLVGEQPDRGVPVFDSPEPAARALARAVDYGAWRRRPPGAVPDLAGLDLQAARAVVEAFLHRSPEGGWLPPVDVHDVLGTIGVPALETVEAASAEEAIRAAVKVGFPVAVKAAGPQLVHKTDVGGVRLGLLSDVEVARAFGDMADRIGEAMTGAVVQPMAEPGVETIIGVTHDPSFGPLLMFGMGGTLTELLGDRSFRILPVTDVDAAELVRSLRSSALLFGYRGAPPVAVAALEQVLQRIARIADAVPELVELDINPLVASADKVTAVDARMKVLPVAAGPPPDLRRMR